jgi:hypothetical protein
MLLGYLRWWFYESIKELFLDAAPQTRSCPNRVAGPSAHGLLSRKRMIGPVSAPIPAPTGPLTGSAGEFSSL